MPYGYAENTHAYFDDVNRIYRMNGALDVLSTQSDLLGGTLSLSPERLRELDQEHDGRCFIFVLSMPKYMRQIAKGCVIENYEAYGHDSAPQRYAANGAGSMALSQQEVARRHLCNMKMLMTHGCLSYSGTPALEMNTTEQDMGWDDWNMDTPLSTSYTGKEFTIRCIETRGEPLRHGLEYLQSGISDPITHQCTLHGALTDNKQELLSPDRTNYTWDFMVINTDETFVRVREISLWRNCLYKSPVDRASLDWELGSPKLVEAKELTFSGFYMPGAQFTPAVWEDAQKRLQTRLTLTRRVCDLTADQLGSRNWLANDVAY